MGEEGGGETEKKREGKTRNCRGGEDQAQIQGSVESAKTTLVKETHQRKKKEPVTQLTEREMAKPQSKGKPSEFGRGKRGKGERRGKERGTKAQKGKWNGGETPDTEKSGLKNPKVDQIKVGVTKKKLKTRRRRKTRTGGQRKPLKKKKGREVKPPGGV